MIACCRVRQRKDVSSHDACGLLEYSGHTTAGGAQKITKHNGWMDFENFHFIFFGMMATKMGPLHEGHTAITTTTRAHRTAISCKGTTKPSLLAAQTPARRADKRQTTQNLAKRSPDGSRAEREKTRQSIRDDNFTDDFSLSLSLLSVFLSVSLLSGYDQWVVCL